MRNIFSVLGVVLVLFSCTNRSSLAHKPLPVPVEKTVNTEGGKKLPVTDHDAEELRVLRERITQISERVICRNAGEWRAVPAGAKACGGPAFYVAFHKSVEIEMMPVIEEYTIKQDLYNKKHGIVSDCMMTAPPSGIKCKEGKAVFVNGNSAGLQTF